MNTDKILGLVALTGFLLYLFGTFPNAHGEVQVFARDLAWNLQGWDFAWALLAEFNIDCFFGFSPVLAAR